MPLASGSGHMMRFHKAFVKYFCSVFVLALQERAVQASYINLIIQL